MYSVVLLMALSSGAETTNFCHKSCSSCSVCYGCSTACYGCSSCAGCYSSCHGCWSSCNGCSSCHGGLFSRMKNRCHGCSSCSGCYSSCHGCSGCYSSCHGCNSCHGVVIYGCNGCTGCYTSCTCGGVIVMPAAPEKKEEKKEEKKKTDAGAAPATIVVNLPADAKLFIDGKATSSTSALRVFETPALETSKEYTYTLTAQVSRNGKTESKIERITVRGGAETPVTIRFNEAAVAAK